MIWRVVNWADWMVAMKAEKMVVKKMKAVMMVGWMALMKMKADMMVVTMVAMMADLTVVMKAD